MISWQFQQKQEVLLCRLKTDIVGALPVRTIRRGAQKNSVLQRNLVHEKPGAGLTIFATFASFGKKIGIGKGGYQEWKCFEIGKGVSQAQFGNFIS